MSVAEVHHLSGAISGPVDLGAWDWKAELKRQERSLSWLARHTERSESAVNKYSRGAIKVPLEWLIAVAAVLGVEIK